MRAFISTGGCRSSVEPRRLPGQASLPIRERIALQAEASVHEAHAILAETEPATVDDGPWFEQHARNGVWSIMGEDRAALAEALAAFVAEDEQ